MRTDHANPPVEISWFGALCDDDYEFLGQPDPALQSSYEHCRETCGRASAERVPAPAPRSSGTRTRSLRSSRAYQEVGVDAFILSGYTHVAECDRFAQHVLRRIDHAPLRGCLGDGGAAE